MYETVHGWGKNKDNSQGYNFVFTPHFAPHTFLFYYALINYSAKNEEHDQYNVVYMWETISDILNACNNFSYIKELKLLPMSKSLQVLIKPDC